MKGGSDARLQGAEKQLREAAKTASRAYTIYVHCLSASGLDKDFYLKTLTKKEFTADLVRTNPREVLVLSHLSTPHWRVTLSQSHLHTHHIFLVPGLHVADERASDERVSAAGAPITTSDEGPNVV